MNPKITGVADGWAILTGATGNLKRAMRYTPGIGQVLIYNDARSRNGFAYAGVHNQGADKLYKLNQRYKMKSNHNKKTTTASYSCSIQFHKGTK
jgi:hypothetical protein